MILFVYVYIYIYLIHIHIHFYHIAPQRLPLVFFGMFFFPIQVEESMRSRSGSGAPRIKPGNSWGKAVDSTFVWILSWELKDQLIVIWLMCPFAKAFLKMIFLFPSSFWLLLLICWPFGPLHSSFCWRLINILYMNYIVFCALVILTFLNVHSTLYRCYTHWIFLPTQQSNFTFKVRSAGRSILSLRSSCWKLLLITAQCWLIHCMVHGVKSM